MDIDAMIAHLALLGWVPKSTYDTSVQMQAVVNTETMIVVWASARAHAQCAASGYIVKSPSVPWDKEYVPAMYQYIMENKL